MAKIDWNATNRKRGPKAGCAVKDCPDEVAAVVAVSVRLKQTGGALSTQVASKSRSLCKQHTEVMYEKMANLLP